MRVLITGGAGFVGSHLARRFRDRDPAGSVVVLDNLRRRGSELNLPVFKQLGIEFIHGDIRNPADLDELPGNFDLFVEASAEPSVLAGVGGSPAYVLQTNLGGTLNCLELARRRAGRVIFLSTSRVYSIAPLRGLRLDEAATRFELAAQQDVPGVSAAGISEHFPVDTARSLYGSTKLASELFVQEYVETYGLKAIINRCGVIAGPGQFGKVDQGVFTLWVAHHHFNKPLKYTGFGGQGKQVRDLLHPDDLFDLLLLQHEALERHSGTTFNVGGGRGCSVSMLELTALCEAATGRSLTITSQPATNAVDIPLYLSDTTRVQSALAWKPRHSAPDIVNDIARWMNEHENELRPLFA